MDAEERGVPFARVNVSKNGEHLTTGFTRQDGSFLLSTRKGTYIFAVDTTSLDFNTALRQGIKSTIAAEEAGTSFKAEAINGVPDPLAPPDATDDEDDQTAKDDDDADTDDDEDEKTKKEEPLLPDQMTDNGYQVSVRTRQNKRVSIPVAVDWTGATKKYVGALGEQACVSGSDCDIAFMSVGGCTATLPLPQFATVSAPPQAPGGSISYNADLNTVTFDDTRNSGGLKAASSGPAVQPAITLKTISVSIADDVPVPVDKPLTTTLKPVALCSGTEVALGEIALSITRDIAPKVYLDWDALHRDKVEVRLVNDGKGTIASGEVVIEVDAGGAPVEFTKIDKAKGCKNLGERALCVVEDLAGDGKTATWPFTFEVKAPDNENTKVTIKAFFQSDALATEKEAEAVKFTIPAKANKP